MKPFEEYSVLHGSIDFCVVYSIKLIKFVFNILTLGTRQIKGLSEKVFWIKATKMAELDHCK